jgi:hypothetical protein
LIADKLKPELLREKKEQLDETRTQGDEERKNQRREAYDNTG